MTKDLEGSRILITGGAGFIGANLVEACLRRGAGRVAVLDCLTYAANPLSLAWARQQKAFAFHQADVVDLPACKKILAEVHPDWVFHLAAESHVDRSIEQPLPFVRTNVQGTASLLQASLLHWQALPQSSQDRFRFVHVSTDEVFGSLEQDGYFREDTPVAPRSPYAASKAASDHLVRAYGHTYGLPYSMTHCGNNFGPYQFPEKLIPLMILRALQGKSLPVYGQGINIRDWIQVEDHCQALLQVAARGRAGQAYVIGARNDRPNLEVVEEICEVVDRLGLTAPGVRQSRDLIRFVEDRPGHDFRYAIDPAKLERETGWRPQREFSQALHETVLWYQENQPWVEECEKSYAGQRLGLGLTSPGGKSS
ncbi:MAG: dTDP-glucose 4,6-dehydratase [Planctomycetota bacterium]|nr:MAG: dTDP-glucose 4,6-dehydratase [Planctomycetota bacterium]